jgi:hypothetical protein
MQGLKSRVDSLPKQVLEAFLIETQSEKMLPGEEPVFVWILTELLKHSSDFLHVELSLNC